MLDAASDAADPAAVALVHRLPEPLAPAATAACSGTLLASNVVATAAHCVADAHGASFDVVTGTKPDAPGHERAAVEKILVHPAYDPGTHAFDIALLRLASDLAVAPFSSPSTGSALLVEGAPVRAVGFGIDGKDGALPDSKRSGSMRVSRVEPDSFDTTPDPSMSCTGDSGGPVLAMDPRGTEQLVGITVYGDPGCRKIAHNLRLDHLQADFVRPFVEQAQARDALHACSFVPTGGTVPALPLSWLLLLLARRYRLGSNAGHWLRQARVLVDIAQLGDALRVSAATLIAAALRATKSARAVAAAVDVACRRTARVRSGFRHALGVARPGANARGLRPHV